MTEIHTGGCLCGAARFEISGPFDDFVLCHCGRCRKDTGSAHAANLFSSRATLRWLAGAEAVRTFRLPGTRHARSFCGVCGSALPGLQMDGALLVVPAGCLEGGAPLAPRAHIFHGSRADWDEGLAQLPAFEGLPG